MTDLTYPTSNGPSHFDSDRLLWITLARINKEDPTRTLCPFELQGGKCSDPGCQTIHLSRDLWPSSEIGWAADYSRVGGGRCIVSADRGAFYRSRSCQRSALGSTPRLPAKIKAYRKGHVIEASDSRQEEISGEKNEGCGRLAARGGFATGTCGLKVSLHSTYRQQHLKHGYKRYCHIFSRLGLT
jgi:hypothetical protein